MSPTQAKRSYQENLPHMALSLWNAGVRLEVAYRLARAAALDFLVRVEDINDTTTHFYGFNVEGAKRKLIFSINTKLP